MALVVPITGNQPPRRDDPGDGNLIMAAGIMDGHDRLVNPEFKAAEASWLSDWWYGKEKPGTPPSAPMGEPGESDMAVGKAVSGKEGGFGGTEHYPTKEEAEFAKSVGLGYGKSWERHFMDQNLRVYGESGKAGWLPQPLFQAGKTSPEAFKQAFVHGDPKTFDFQQLSPEAKQRMGDVVARAALAAGRDPIATLGFDPQKSAFSMQKQATTLGGFTLAYDPTKKITTPKQMKEARIPDTPIYINQAHNEVLDAPSVMVHESVHRGLQLLFDRSQEAVHEYNKMFDRWADARSKVQALKESDADPNELLVRHIMRTTMGNPEQWHSMGQLVRNDQIEAAEEFFQDPKNLASVAKIQAMAAKEVAKLHGGRGPR